jgi:hypothetical protein
VDIVKLGLENTPAHVFKDCGIESVLFRVSDRPTVLKVRGTMIAGVHPGAFGLNVRGNTQSYIRASSRCLQRVKMRRTQREAR